MASPAGNYYRRHGDGAPRHAPLQGPVDASTCIVGGGFAGLNTALGLAARGERDLCLLEAGTVAEGASGRNGGFVFGGFSLGEQALLDQLGPERARRLYAGTQRAVHTVRERVGPGGIACDAVDAGVLWANWFRDPAPLRRRQRLLADHFDTHWDWVPRERLREQVRSERYGDALFEANALHLDPVAYARGLAARAAGQGVRVHEASPARRLRVDGAGWRIETDHGVVRARRVVLACGGYLAGLRPEVDASVLPIATYVMVTEPLGERMADVLRTRAAIYDTRFAFDYYRPLPDTRLLWGGRISVRDRPAGEVARLLRRDLARVFPALREVRIDHAWSGLMSYARHEMPQIGEVAPGLWLAQAFGGHGLAPTTMAGEALAAALTGEDDPWGAFGEFGLAPAYKPAGLLAAQLNYWWLQAKDAARSWSEGRWT